MKTLVRKRSSANSLSLNPLNYINHCNTDDFSNSKNLDTTVLGTLPTLIAAAKSLGKFFNDLPASASTIKVSSLFLSFADDPSSPPPPSPPPPPLLPLLLLLLSSPPGNDTALFAIEKVVSRW